MAEDKKGFVLYADLIHTVSQLPNDKAGELFKHILEYVNDNDPKTDDLVINISFEPIKQQLKRDLEKYYKTCDRNKINGSKGGRPKNPTEPKKPTGLSDNPTEPKKPDTDSDSDKDSDKEKEIINNIYNLYPSRCLVKNASTGKSHKDKIKIKSLIQEIGIVKLEKIIKWYIKECTTNKVYLKNFKTFLNNLPDIDESKPNEGKLYTYKVHFTMYRNKTEKQYKEALKQYGDNLILQ